VPFFIIQQGFTVASGLTIKPTKGMAQNVGIISVIA
jgi:hypothetical protein